MRSVLLFCLFLASSPLHADIDRSSSSFQMRQVRHHIDRFDFSGSFPNLEDIDIDARKKKRVEFDLSGDYPKLTTVNYEGNFGHLKGVLTGSYPILSSVNILCTSCAMQLNLAGEWKKSCQITIRGMKEDVVLTLPDDVGLIIHTKTSASGKVITKEGLKKQGWFKIWKKTYHNALAETAPIVLTLDIETTDGKIILN